MKATNNKNLNNYKIEEHQVIKRILGGEKELYEILVRRNNQLLYRVIRSYIKDNAEIEDLMQDAYIRAFNKLYQFKFKSTFSTWLIRIGINKTLARIKEKRKLYHLNERDEKKSNSILEIPDNKQLNPQAKMIQKESKQLLESAIDNLKPKYKIIYILKEVEGLSLKEIATTLDLTVSNVKVRLHRAKKMLKKQLYKATMDKKIFEFGFSKCDRVTENVMKLIAK